MSRPVPPRRVTIRDVAAAAGVSTTTVSHALNDKGHVDPETRSRVVRVAADLGYRASRAARALRSGRSGVIAMLLPELVPDNGEQPALALEYYMRITAAAARTAFARGYPLLLTPPPTSASAIHDLGVDGAIIVDPRREDPRIGMFIDAGLPIVSIERDLGRPTHRAYVQGDNRAATRELLDHLRSVGARRIAMLATDADWAWARESEETYMAWAAEHDAPALLARAELQSLEPTARARALDLLSADERPDAIFALAEGSATGTLRAARELGLSVPDDLLIAGGIDSGELRAGEPQITTIDLQPDLQGAAAAELLVARLSDPVDGTPVPEGPVLVPTELRLRASTDRGARV